MLWSSILAKVFSAAVASETSFLSSRLKKARYKNGDLSEGYHAAFKSQSARFRRVKSRPVGGHKAWLSAAIHGWRSAAPLPTCRCSSDTP